ncbi:MAG: TrmO family methyltransferase domain-containing protein, partial [Phyllobacterium sp.]
MVCRPDRSRPDLVLQNPAGNGRIQSAFSPRSPARANTIGTSIVSLAGVAGNILTVNDLDCRDGTPLL